MPWNIQTINTLHANPVRRNVETLANRLEILISTHSLKTKRTIPFKLHANLQWIPAPLLWPADKSRTISPIRQWKNWWLLLLFPLHLLKPTAIQTLIVLSTTAGSPMPIPHNDWQRSSNTMLKLRLGLICKLEVRTIDADERESAHGSHWHCYDLWAWYMEARHVAVFAQPIITNQAFHAHILYSKWNSVAIGSSYLHQYSSSSSISSSITTCHL